MGKRQDHLEQWTIWLRDALSARGKNARVAYDDKLGGDVLVLAIDAGAQDKLVEVTITRRPKGRAHLTVLATTLEGATAARDAIGRMHDEVSRLANAKRKFVHRIERMLAELATSWGARQGQGVAERDEALARLLQHVPQAEPMTGIGFHTDVAGAEDHHTKETYPTVFGVAVELEGRWRGLAWDPEQRRWVMRQATLTAFKKAHPEVDLEKSGISLLDAALVGAAVVGAAAIAASINDEVQTKEKSGIDSSWCDLSDLLDPCDLLDCSLSSADFGNCVPDCDLGGLDCGGLDCSL
ncbi:MAG TPA: hypothetical protein VM261_03245 [Kofleriaceae bacterium]|nr:hypothetical protein [Kofleriaceae bacterium]